MEVKRNYVAGRWLDPRESVINENPSDLDSPVGLYATSSVSDVAEAVEAAEEAFPAWSRTTPPERAELLNRVADELASRQDELGRLLALEEGKTLSEGVGEVARAADIFRYYAAETYRVAGELLPSARPGVEIEVRRRPVGVVGVITPWNFPMAIPAWKIAPALAYGNTVVFKPAELVPGCAWELTAALDRAGIPRGVFNLVMGQGAQVGEALVTNAKVKAVTFTGSNAVGKRVASAGAARLARVQLELGGKNALVVLDDADVGAAVESAVSGAYYSTGQRCTASSRIIVTSGVHDEFVAALAARVRSLRVGHALDEATEVGPVVDERQLEKDLAYVTLGKEEGATALVEGSVMESRTRGYYLTPTLFVNSSPGMRINQEEMFGPIAAVMKVGSYEEALSVANDTRYGLVAAIHTNSLQKAAHFRENVEAGMCMVNLPTAGQEYHAPFGGTNESSYGGREQGTHAREFFTETRTAYVNHR